VSWQNGKQGIVELYGEGSTEIKEFPKNIYYLNGLCFGDIKDKDVFADDNCANLHSFRKYSYSTKNKQCFNNRCINFYPYNLY